MMTAFFSVLWYESRVSWRLKRCLFIRREGQHCAVRHRGVLPFKSTIPSAHVVHGLSCEESYGGFGGAQRAQEQVRTTTNKEVLRFWRLAPCDVESRVRRVKWAQTLVQNPARAGLRELEPFDDRGVVQPMGSDVRALFWIAN